MTETETKNNLPSHILEKFNAIVARRENVISGCHAKGDKCFYDMTVKDWDIGIQSDIEAALLQYMPDEKYTTDASVASQLKKAIAEYDTKTQVVAFVKHHVGTHAIVSMNPKGDGTILIDPTCGGKIQYHVLCLKRTLQN